MTIRITDNGPIRLTQEQYDVMYQSWQASQSMTTCPRSFEAYIRACLQDAQSAVERMKPFLFDWKS